MPDIPDGHGATVVFDGVSLGELLDVTPAFAAGNIHETTSMGATIVGAGQNARVIRQYNVTSIEPGTIVIKCLGYSPLTRDDIGRPGALSFVFGNGSLSGQAVPIAVDATIATGELVQWSATFQFTGY